MKTYLRKKLHKFLLKKGLGLKSYNLVKEILLAKRQRKGIFTMFFIIAKALSSTLRLCNIANIKRGRFTIFILLNISFSRSFHLALKTIIANSLTAIKKKNFDRAFTHEIVFTVKKKSGSFEAFLKHRRLIKKLQIYSNRGPEPNPIKKSKKKINKKIMKDRKRQKGVKRKSKIKVKLKKKK